MKLVPSALGAITLSIALPLVCGAAGQDYLQKYLEGTVKFKAGSFVIENRSAYYWENCELRIDFDDQQRTFELDGVDLTSGQVAAFPASKFTQAYPAETYNPRKYPPLVMRIACEVNGHTMGQDFAIN